MPSYEPDKVESRDRRDLVVPVAFLLLSGILLILPVPVQQQLSSALRGTVLAPFIWTQESFQETRVRASELTNLRARLDSVVAVAVSQRTLLEENQRLRALLELRQRMGPGFVPASAMHPGTRGSESMFLLDAGTNDGVRVNSPVVVSEGLVGVVREAGPTTSLAMDWTHPDFRASVMTQDGNVFGIVESYRGAFREEDRLLLNGVPYHTPVDDGTAVVTSGRGSVYPRGIMVGTVAGLAESEAGWRRSYWLEPAVRPGSATHVLIFSGDEVAPTDIVNDLWLPMPDSVEIEGDTLPAEAAEEVPVGSNGMDP